MFLRDLSVSKNSSFFLFGARATGKTTWLRKEFLASMEPSQPHHFIDLLSDETERRYQRSPDLLESDLKALRPQPHWVVIDEIQKVPQLLNVIHRLIESKKYSFALTGSSARKLKISGANMLAGRAFDYRLFPLTAGELGSHFVLSEALKFGLLPSVFSFSEDQDKAKFLKSYVSQYVKLEVQLEQLVRKIEPFRGFLEIAAQMNGKQINFAKIGREVGVDPKTIQTYYSILEETYLGFQLPAFHRSQRKSQLLSPKFYFFDVGVCRAILGGLTNSPIPGTSYYGEVFEHFVMLEFYKANWYREKDFRLSYLGTKASAEVDLILSLGKKDIFIEIKSALQISEKEVRSLATVSKLHKAESYYLSNDPTPTELFGVRCLPWQLGLNEIFAR